MNRLFPRAAAALLTSACGAQCPSWTFIPPFGETGDLFGAVSVVQDDTAVVLEAGCELGSRYLVPFARNGVNWIPGELFASPDLEECASFGGTLALQGDDLIVGAKLSSIDEFQCGRCYVYTRVDGTWTLAQTIPNPQVEYNARFGHAIALEGNTLAISATAAGGDFQGGGRVDIFHRTAPRGEWLLEQSIDAPETPGGGAFGYQLGLLNGELFVVHPGIGATPKLIMYRRLRGVWSEFAQVGVIPGFGSEAWGESLAVAGERLAVGVTNGWAPGLPASGIVQVFDRSGDTWTPSAVVAPVNPAGGQVFGWSVALSGDGRTLMVGAPNDNAGGTHAGSVSIFREVRGAWVFEKKLFGEPAVPGSQLGWDIAYDPVADIAVIGRGSTNEAFVYEGFAPSEEDDCNGNGEADVCDIASGSSADQNRNGVPDECEPASPPGDLNADGLVGSVDLAILLGMWGTRGTCGAGCDGDLNGNGVVEAADLAALLAGWS